MLTGETTIRVRYGETDKMGYVYYGCYPQYYEVGRTEMIRSLGITYKSLEETGIMMPVVSLNIKYHKSAFYDELLTIRTIVKERPTVKIQFFYEIYNENNELINEGDTTLVFVNQETRRPCKTPSILLDEIKKYF